MDKLVEYRTLIKSIIKNNKIWIEEDWTDEGIGNALVEAGVPQNDIVLAFYPPEGRARMPVPQEIFAFFQIN